MLIGGGRLREGSDKVIEDNIILYWARINRTWYFQCFFRKGRSLASSRDLSAQHSPLLWNLAKGMHIERQADKFAWTAFGGWINRNGEIPQIKITYWTKSYLSLTDFAVRFFSISKHGNDTEERYRSNSVNDFDPI